VQKGKKILCHFLQDIYAESIRIWVINSTFILTFMTFEVLLPVSCFTLARIYVLCVIYVPTNFMSAECCHLLGYSAL
jgi:hypothetical protein